MKRIHIDENVTIRTSWEADKAFLKENDLTYFEDEKGVVKVTKERWEKAQRTEFKHWMKLGINAKDDRNFYHAEKFNNYQSLSGLTFKHALEVGCGPFTNLRIVANFCKIQKCSLNDPLINDYLNHANCSYNHTKLTLDEDSSNPSRPFLGRFFKKKLPVDRLYACPFEEMPIDTKFDLIVIINVIEHCFDLDLFFNKIMELLSDGGIVIFEDKLFELDKLKEDINTVYDAAHPLRVNKDLVISFLNKNLIKKYCEIQSNSTQLEGIDFAWEDIYFIGQKI
ncbi:MAG: Methyltransferase type 11 [Segetibacter sp.]|nr:Methyltransferase type 11 [Segetibacter sp.]